MLVNTYKFTNKIQKKRYSAKYVEFINLKIKTLYSNIMNNVKNQIAFKTKENIFPSPCVSPATKKKNKIKESIIKNSNVISAPKNSSKPWEKINF